MSITLAMEAAEAIDAALLNTGFEALGNTEGGRVDWWFRGTRGTPKCMRVNVARNTLIDGIIVTAEFPNVAHGTTYRGSVTWQLPCGALERSAVIDASRGIVEKVLELFKEIITGTGSAAPEAVGIRE